MHMPMCVPLCTHTCMFMCPLSIYIRVCVYVCACAHLNVLCVLKCAHFYMCMLTCVHSCKQMLLCVLMHVCVLITGFGCGLWISVLCKQGTHPQLHCHCLLIEVQASLASAGTGRYQVPEVTPWLVCEEQRMCACRCIHYFSVPVTDV